MLVLVKYFPAVFFKSCSVMLVSSLVNVKSEMEASKMFS